ncbi:MAG: hypothetical protein E7618_05495 [Ruminococcaceae bacterium]|nr:hypothetical protein [Oscillospiraceae bacterium]
MEQKKLVIVINGAGGVGKDTLCNALTEDFSVINISAITPIKEIAAQHGWKGEKDDRSRRFLAELKRIFADYNDLPTRYLVEQYHHFAASDAEILCVHIRESDQIARFVREVSLPCLSLLVRRDVISSHHYGNQADDEVENYPYDLIFDNNAPEEESKQAFRAQIRRLYEEKNHA